MIHNSHQRIELGDDLRGAIIKVAEGNPGALSVLIQAYKRSPELDPDGAMGGLMPILHCDSYGLYGAKVWILYKDVCGGRIDAFLAVLRGCQMGLVVSGDPETVRLEDVDTIWDRVCDQLPSFGKRVS